MTQARSELILHRPERAIADEFGITLEEVQTILDEHPVEDAIHICAAALPSSPCYSTVGRMAFEDRNTAASALLVKLAERRATLLGLNPPLGQAVPRGTASARAS